MVATNTAYWVGTSFRLSVPFSSGQWLLPVLQKLGRVPEQTFSPLFIGAMVATGIGPGSRPTTQSFSPLFIGAMVAT